MAHEAEIIVPGSFVVLQGIPGDGLSNTIDTAPFLMEDYDHLILEEEQASAHSTSTSGFHHVMDHHNGSTSAGHNHNDVLSYDDSSSEEQPLQATTSAAAAAAVATTTQRSPMLMGAGYNSLLSNNPATVSMTPLVLNPTSETQHHHQQQQQQRPTVDTSTTSAFIVVNEQSSSSDEDRRKQQQQLQQDSLSLSRAQMEAIQHWEVECRNREVRERKDIYPNISSRDEMWWQSRGKLTIFSELPHKVLSGAAIQRMECGSLSPGCTVVGIRLVTLDSNTLKIVKDKKMTRSKRKSSSSSSNLYPRGCTGIVQMLEIESPQKGWVVLSLDGYCFLGPGLPSMYTDPQTFLWRVTCLDGAIVRQGLELTSPKVETLPYGSLLRVTRKTINSMGLSRLRIQALTTTTTTTTHHEQNKCQVEGWISEALNPLSGQRGPIVQAVPFPVPAQYRVSLPDGAVVRSGVELVSSQIGHAPQGAMLTVVGRAFSDSPMDQCIERFQLAGGGGWVSAKLNRPPPYDLVVLEAVGIDGTFDPESPGVFHLEAHDNVRNESLQQQQQQQQQQTIDLTTGGGNHQPQLYRRTSTSGDLSSINEEEDEVVARNHFDLSSSSSSTTLSHPETTSTTPGTTSAVPTLFRSGGVGSSSTSSVRSLSRPSARRGGAARGGLQHHHDAHCLICLTEERNATIVHGETGHIACCLACARILKARGDKCPVCRLPIDSVIQQFWA